VGSVVYNLMRTTPLPERKTLIRAALGEEPLDLIIKNIRLVNVYTGHIEPGSIGIINGRIATPYAFEHEALNEIDGANKFALPGFIDSHVHLDSTLVVPENLGSLLLRHSTTVMLADPMEIANVAGLDGFKVFQNSQPKWPYHVFWEVSSRVPTAPGLETTGGELGLEEVEEILQWPETVSLGELDPSKVLGLRDDYLLKVEAAQRLGKICNGHAIGRVGRELAAYACGGLSDDHECVNFSDALSRLQLGMSVLIREGSTERNLEMIIRGLLEHGLHTSPHLMFCTDDKHPDEILEEGHIDYMINKAIKIGVPPVIAVQMATINPAKHFRIEHMVGSLTPGRWADIVLSEKLLLINPTDVFFKGKQVVQDGKFVVSLPPPDYPDWLYKTVHVQRGNKANDYILEAPGDKAKVWVIDLYPDQIINTRSKAELNVQDGSIQADISRDILKLAVVERYGKNGQIGVTFVRGFGLKEGAIASSVAHDHHNIIVSGTNDVDMAACVREIVNMQGGFAISVGGEVVGNLELPIGGLLSDKPVNELIDNLNEINQIYRQLGGKLPAPFMTISFIGLPTVPDLGLSDKGLIDVLKHEIISSIV